MSTAHRVGFRELYLQGWYRMDANLLLAATADAFIFDDPAEPAPLTRDGLEARMPRRDLRIPGIVIQVKTANPST